MASHFYNLLLQRLTTDLLSYQSNNTDKLRYPTARVVLNSRRCFVSALDRLLGAFGCIRNNAYQRGTIVQNLVDLECHLEGLEWLYHRLGDDESRNTLIELIVFRIGGTRHTRLSRNNSTYRDAIKTQLPRLVVKSRSVKGPALDGWLDDFRITIGADTIHLTAHKINVLTTFLLEQYQYVSSNGTAIRVEPNDVVIDGGGCWGDTALYFAAKAGSLGRVATFECSESNLHLMYHNLVRNPELQSRITVHEQALWDASGRTLHLSERGPSTAVTTDADHGCGVMTQSIDCWAKQVSPQRVNFIKMDIEGAEVRSLMGAREVIERFRPRLAVAVYHSLEDFLLIPQQIDSITSGYSFYLGHYTIHEEESILFGISKNDCATL